MTSVFKKYVELSLEDLLNKLNEKVAVLPVDTITVRQFEGGVTPTYALQFTKGIASPVKFQIDVVFVGGYIHVRPQYLDMTFSSLSLDDWAEIMIVLTNYEASLNNNWHKRFEIGKSDIEN